MLVVVAPSVYPVSAVCIVILRVHLSGVYEHRSCVWQEISRGLLEGSSLDSVERVFAVGIFLIIKVICFHICRKPEFRTHLGARVVAVTVRRDVFHLYLDWLRCVGCSVVGAVHRSDAVA